MEKGEGTGEERGEERGEGRGEEEEKCSPETASQPYCVHWSGTHLLLPCVTSDI